MSSNVSQVAAALGGGATVNGSGQLTAPSYTFQSNTYDNAGSTFTAIDSGFSALKTQIGSGTIGLVQQASGSAPITVGGSTGGTSVDFTGTGGTRTLTGVSAGTLSAASTDAVNGGQLYATNQNVATNTTNIATNTTAISTLSSGTAANMSAVAAALGGGASVNGSGQLTAPSYSVQGGTYNNVGGALGALDTQVTTNTTDIASLDTTVAGLASTGAYIDIASSGPAASATGTNAMAIGPGASATGTDAIAIGDGAVSAPNSVVTGGGATDNGASGASIYGTGANVTLASTDATAIGFNANVNGANAIAIGGNATAANAASATAADAVAIGNQAQAGGTGAVALGNNTSAGFSNSAAIGNGATATRADQQVFGTATNTYTAPGITSAASKAAQTGPTQIVTSDAGGNLSTSTLAGLGLATSANIASINSQLNSMNNRINDLYTRSDKADAGVAMAFAMAGVPTLMPGEHLAMTMNYGTFQGQNGLAINAAYRLANNMQLAGGIGYGPNEGLVGGRVGLRVAW